MNATRHPRSPRMNAAGAAYYSTRVLGGSGAVYAPDAVRSAFCPECQMWVLGTTVEVKLHAAGHGITVTEVPS